jgi:site-specific DNA recombinase
LAAPKAVGYIRVSTLEQVREGWSLTAQRRRVKDYCRARGWKLARIYADEGLSGANGKKRPAFDEMVSDVLADGVTHVVALKLDRLGRSAAGLLNLYDRLESKGTALVCIEESIDTSTPHGKLLRTLLAGVAEFERDIIAQRTKVGLEAARKAGKRLGAVPYGYVRTEDGGVVREPHEQAAIRLARRLRRQGRSLREVAEALTAEGYVPKGGGAWHPTAVNRIVKGGKGRK